MREPKKPKITHDWETEQKRIKIIYFVSAAIAALVVILVIVAVMRGHY